MRLLGRIVDRRVGDELRVDGGRDLRNHAVGEEFAAQFGKLFAELVEEHGPVGEVVADAGCLFGQLDGPRQLGQGGRDAIEDRVASFFFALGHVPVV